MRQLAEGTILFTAFVFLTQSWNGFMNKGKNIKQEQKHQHRIKQSRCFRESGIPDPPVPTASRILLSGYAVHWRSIFSFPADRLEGPVYPAGPLK